MSLNDKSYDRIMLKDVLAELKAKHPEVKPKEAWVIKTCGMWEFHYKGFYWSEKANSAWDARVQGWEAWMKSWEASMSKKAK
jgi:hypothetical protein